jgi:hypothetical protein
LTIIIIILAAVVEEQCTDFEVRLTYRGLNGAIGNLELCSENLWQTLHLDALGLEALDVACLSLGFTEFGSDFEVLRFPAIQSITQQRAPLFFYCAGNETTLEDCTISLGSSSAELRVACLGK